MTTKIITHDRVATLGQLKAAIDELITYWQDKPEDWKEIPVSPMNLDSVLYSNGLLIRAQLLMS